MAGTEHRQGEEWPNLNKPGAADAEDKGTGAGGARKGEITQELQELGQRLAATARAAWQSEQRQELQREITDGLRLLRDQIGEAVEGAKTNPRTQNVVGSVKEQVTKAADSARIPDLFDDIRASLGTGLRELNDQLRRFTERLERHDEAAAATDSPTDTAATRAAAGSAGAAESSAEINELLAVDAPGMTATGQARHDLPATPEGGTSPTPASDATKPEA